MKCTQNIFKLVSVFIIHILVYLCNKEYKDTFFNTALMDQNFSDKYLDILNKNHTSRRRWVMCINAFL